MSAAPINIIKIKDKEFRLLITSQAIQSSVKLIAEKMNAEFKGKNPLFIAVLNGSFLFAADLVKSIAVDCEITFVKLASYSGNSTTGVVKELIGLSENISGRTVIVLEDIVDSGITLESLYAQLKKMNPAELKVAALFFKPGCYTKNIRIDYVGMEVPNDFLVGYGLDYDGLGRNLEDIYTEIKN